jgi:hypothetical protein
MNETAANLIHAAKETGRQEAWDEMRRRWEENCNTLIITKASNGYIVRPESYQPGGTTHVIFVFTSLQEAFKQITEIFTEGLEFKP